MTGTLDPCGIHKDLYAQAITSGVRRYLDLSMKAITCVPEHQKESVRRFVDARFDSAIGQKSWKEKLSKAFRVNKQKACKAFLEKKEKHNWLRVEIWERIQSLVYSEEFKISSERNKLNRKAQLNVTNIGRKGFQGMKERLATQLQRSPSQKELFLEAHTSKGYGAVSRGEISSFASTIFEDIDVIEKTPTEGSQTQVSSKKVITSMQKKHKCRKDILSDLEAKASHYDESLKRNLEEKDKEISRMHEELEKLKTLVASSQVIDSVKPSSIAMTSMSTPKSCDKVSALMVGQRVRILEMGTKRTVGLGTLLSLDPNFSVHTVPIDIGFAGVRVEEAFVRNALLFRSSEETQFLGDTVGFNVAWHTHYLCSL